MQTRSETSVRHLCWYWLDATSLTEGAGSSHIFRNLQDEGHKHRIVCLVNIQNMQQEISYRFVFCCSAPHNNICICMCVFKQWRYTHRHTTQRQTKRTPCFVCYRVDWLLCTSQPKKTESVRQKYWPNMMPTWISKLRYKHTHTYTHECIHQQT